MEGPWNYIQYPEVGHFSAQVAEVAPLRARRARRSPPARQGRVAIDGTGYFGYIYHDITTDLKGTVWYV